MAPGRRRGRKPKKRAAIFKTIVINGKDDVTPNECHLIHKDWVCWVNPNKNAFTVSFVAKNPLKGLKDGKVTVAKGKPSPWYQLKGSVTKGDRFEYKVAKPRSRVGSAPGPIIISDD